MSSLNVCFDLTKPNGNRVARKTGTSFGNWPDRLMFVTEIPCHGHGRAPKERDMKHARPLPEFLVNSYRGWKAVKYRRDEARYRQLASEGQHPPVMAIACCDSRVNIESIFDAGPGEFFVHRNIAALAPPHIPGENRDGASAAVEYAVRVLKVAHITVLGHSGCGGVNGCHDMCMGLAPELEEKSSHVGRWVDLLRPGFERVKHMEDDDARRRALEREAVLQSLQNLMTFQFVSDAVERDRLSLHGLWHDIGEGRLEVYDAASGAFVPVGAVDS